MKNPELSKWYEEKDLGYFIKPLFKGTNIFIRGDVPNLTEFLFHLERIYHPESKNDIYENYKILKKALSEGEITVNDSGIIYFGDDRITSIKRTDIANSVSGGLYEKSENNLELIFNEQYGGGYPDIPSCSSRAWIINNSMKAIEDMRPKQDRKYNSVVDNLLKK